MAQAVLVCISILLGGGISLLLAGRWLKGRWPVWIALALLLISACPLLLLRGGPQELTPASWILEEPWNVLLSYRFDALSRGFALLGGVSCLLLLLWMGTGGADEDGRFSPWLLISLAIFLHLLSSADLLVTYASWEGLLLVTYLLLVYRRETLPTAGIAEWFLGIQHLAGYPLLAALMLIGRPLGTLHYPDLSQGVASSLALLLLLITAWVRTAQVPFQGWVLASAETPAPVSTLLLGGWNLLAGPYLWLRFLTRVSEHAPYELAMMAGGVSLIMGAVLALQQRTGRQIQAGDTISRMGLLWIALGLGNPWGIAASLFLMLDLVLGKGLFHLALTERGRFSPPFRRVAFALGAWGAAGLPLSSGFVARWLLWQGLRQAGRTGYLPLVLLSTPLALAYLWRGWTLLSREEPAATPLWVWGQRILVGLAVLLATSGAIAAWLWRLALEPAAMAIPGMVVVVVRALLQELQQGQWVGLALLLLVGLPLGFWSGILRWPRAGSAAANPEGAVGLLQESPELLLRESAWMAQVAQPAPLYHFFGRAAGQAAGAVQRLVMFLEQHTTYFLLVTLVLAGVILIVLTR